MSYDPNDRCNLVVVTAATTMGVSLDTVKRHLRITGSDENDVVTQYLNAAIEWVQEQTGVQLFSTTFRQSHRCTPSDEIRLRRNPVSSVTSVKYIDSTGTLQTWDSSEYQVDLDALIATIRPAHGESWPSYRFDTDNAIQVTYVAGYASVAAIPAIATQCVCLATGHMHEHREPVITGTISKALEMTLDSLLTKMRIVAA